MIPQIPDPDSAMTAGGPRREPPVDIPACATRVGAGYRAARASMAAAASAVRLAPGSAAATGGRP